MEKFKKGMFWLKNYIRGIKDGLPICLGYISVSFAFGLMASRGGLSVLSSVLISLTNLTSAGQFAGLEIITATGTLLEIAFATLIINLRYFLMSLSLTQRFDSSTGTLKRLVMSFGITDEIFAVSMQRTFPLTFVYFLGLMTLPIVGWSFGTFLGAFASSLLPEIVRLSLGMAIYAMFIAIIIPPAKKSKPILNIILIAVAISTFFYVTPVINNISGGWRIIISTVIASGIGAWLYPEKEDEKNE